MKRAAWLVLCPAARLVPLRAIKDSLGEKLRAMTVVESDAMLIEVDDPDGGGPVVVSVTAQHGDHVRTEAEDIALGYGEKFSRRDQLATFDARYEIVCPAERSVATFPLVTAIAGILRAHCDGVIFDTSEGTLLRGVPAMPIGLEQALDYQGELVAVWDWSADDERLALCSIAGGKLNVLAAANMNKAERKTWEHRLIERGVRVGATAGTSPFTWSFQRGFTAWSLTGTVVEVKDGILETGAGARIRPADVDRVVAFLDDHSLGHRGVKVVTNGGSEIVVAEEDDPTAQLDPTYGMDNAQIDAAWVTFMARDLAEWLGVPLTGALA